MLYLVYILLAVFALACLLLGWLCYRQRRMEVRLQAQLHDFTGFVHDMRTPLSMVKSSLDELEETGNLSEGLQKSLAVLQKNLTRLLDMSALLLDWQKAEMQASTLRLVSCDLNIYLEEKRNDFLPLVLRKGLELRTEIPLDMPSVWMDRDKMDRIVDNLLGNALKYTYNGSVSLQVQPGASSWTLRVCDTGIGIPHEEQSRIFCEAHRARNAVSSADSGTGLGLLLVRRLVEQHQGTISFDSVEGKGSIFTVTFPLRPKGTVVSEEPENTDPSVEADEGTDSSAGGGDKEGLLLAEDDADMREYLVEALSSEYQVVSVADGKKALETAREINPDLIVYDVMMPALTGDELCRMLKSSVDTSHIPIVLLTGLCTRQDIIYGLEAGANDYIIKPFDLSVLKARLRNILQERQRVRSASLSAEEQPEEVDYSTRLDQEFMDKVRAIVEQELANPSFGINDFCRQMGMSRTSIYNKLKTLTGKGPADYIRIMRLNKGKALLQMHRYTIGEVSSLVGFSDPKYFSTCFKKQFGISPSKL